MQTISIKVSILQPNAGKQAVMLHMADAYREACAFFLAEAERLGTTSRATLNRETYAEGCRRFNLNRATLQMAMLKALTTRRSYLSLRRKKRKTTPPKFNKPLPVMVRQDCYSVVRLQSGAYALKFPVAAGRSQITVPLQTGAYHDRRFRDLAEGLCRQGSMELWRGKDGNWYTSVTLAYGVSLYEPGETLGVDLGVVKHAAVASADGLVSLFFNGRPARWRKERWTGRRKALQEAGRLTRVKREAGRERRWMSCANHVISRHIVDFAKARKAAITLEQLTGIRERARGSRKFNRMMSGWNFKELAAFIEYKAALAGVPVVYVDPKETSRMCPKCGHVSRYNRRSQGWFRCTHCGYQSDADRVGAINIARRSMSAGYNPAGKGSVTPLMAQGHLVNAGVGTS